MAKTNIKKKTLTKKVRPKARKGLAGSARSTGMVEDALIRYSIEGAPNGGRITGKKFDSILQKSPLDLNDWAAVVDIRPRTLANRIKDGKEFGSLETDRILLVLQVLQRGIEVFGDAGKFQRWLERPHPILGSQRPKDLLHHSMGIGQVLAELGRIEHGIF